MELWDLISSYRPCSLKSYTVYACTPTKGTVIINKFEHPELLSTVGEETWFELDSPLLQNNPAFKRKLFHLVSLGMASIVSNAFPVVVCGTQCELHCLSASEFLSSYKAVSPKGSLAHKVANGSLTWEKCKPIINKGVDLVACFVPKDITGYVKTGMGTLTRINHQSVEHGKGDFVVAEISKDSNELTYKRVVNGVAFCSMFETSGWADCISMSDELITQISTIRA